jgi:hypothetical protein
VLDEMQRRLEQNPDAMRIRRSSVEHPYGTIKSWMGATHFLTKGLEGVATEMSLHVLAYNFRRLIAILGITCMLAAIRAYARFLQRFSLFWRLVCPDHRKCRVKVKGRYSPSWFSTINPNLDLTGPADRFRVFTRPGSKADVLHLACLHRPRLSFLKGIVIGLGE